MIPHAHLLLVPIPPHAPTYLLSVFRVLPFLNTSYRQNIQCMVSCLWLLFLNIIFMRFVCVMALFIDGSFLVLNSIPSYGFSTSVYLPVDGLVGYFQVSSSPSHFNMGLEGGLHSFCQFLDMTSKMCVCVFSLFAQGNKTECGVRMQLCPLQRPGKVHPVPFLPLLESNSKQGVYNWPAVEWTSQHSRRRV